MAIRMSLLRPFYGIFTSRRYVNMRYFNPQPRSYRRRVHEAALAPLVPKRLEEQLKKAKDPFNIYSFAADELIDPEKFTKYELALVKKLREWITFEQFRVMAICQMNATKEEAFWLARNEFRLKEVELCSEPSKIFRKVFERSRLRAIIPLLVDECTCLLFGKDPEQCIYQMMETSAAHSWIQPIAFVVDSRILSVDFVSELSSKDSLMKLRCQTAQKLDRTLQKIPATMDIFIGQISRTLDTHLKANGQR